MDGVLSGVRYATDPEVGGGAGFDDSAELDQSVQDILLAIADLFQALWVVGALDDFFCRSFQKHLLFIFQFFPVYLDAEFGEF